MVFANPVIAILGNRYHVNIKIYREIQKYTRILVKVVILILESWQDSQISIKISSDL